MGRRIAAVGRNPCRAVVAAGAGELSGAVRDGFGLQLAAASRWATSRWVSRAASPLVGAFETFVGASRQSGGMAKHRLVDVRKGSDFSLMWRGWRRKGRGKVPKRSKLRRKGSFRVAFCSCGWESEHFKGETAIESAVKAWESHRWGPGRADAARRPEGSP